MTRKIWSMLLCILIMMGAVPAFAQSIPLTLTDMADREVTLDGAITRIVALSASDCEILYALGAGDTLVGRGTYCNYPEQVLSVPEVNTGSQTSLEEILALEPQVVIMTTMAQTQEQVAVLESAGVKVVASDAQSIEGVYTAIEMIGKLVGKTDEAHALTAQMQETFGTIAKKAENTGKTVYFEVSPLMWGLWTAGRGTFMDELANMCGLTNAFEDVDGWVQISQEQVLERNPDYIVTLTMDSGEGPTPVEEIKSRAGWESLTAVVNDQVFNSNSDEITRPGPRIENAAEALYLFVTGDDSIK